MATVLITGCNRGIGLELARQYSERGDTVIAVCRSASEELRELDVEIVEDVDLGDGRSVGALRETLRDRPIDILLNNAGILHDDSFGEIDYEAMLDQYRVNTLGPLRLTEALAGNLHEGSRVAIVSSRVGSIGDNASGGHYGYRASKSAVNQVGKNLALELAPRGIAVALLHPGMVATGMTGDRGIAPAAAARGLIARIDELTPEVSGRFWHAEGYELPW